MRLLKFNHKNKKIDIKEPGPALKKTLKKLHKLKDNHFKGLTAVGEYLVDSITQEKTIEEAEKTIQFNDRPGGSPTNTAINFYKLGIKSHLIAKIGHDFNGKYLLKKLSEQYFPPIGIVKDYEKSTSRVLKAMGVGDLSKTFREADTNLQYEEVNQKLLHKAFCITSGIFSVEYPVTRETIIKIFEEAKNNGQFNLIDPNFNGYSRFQGFTKNKPISNIQTDVTSRPNTIEKNEKIIIDKFIEKYYKLCDIITPSDDDAKRYFGADITNEEACKKYYKMSNGALVLLTLGARGTILYDGKYYYHVAAFSDMNKVCPNGAGDAFKSGFLAALERAETYEDIIYSIALGNVIGAYATTKIGAWVNFPGLGKWFYLGKKLLRRGVKIYQDKI